MKNNIYIPDPCCPVCTKVIKDKECCSEQECCNCYEQGKADYKRYIESIPKECEQQSDEQILKDYAEFKRKVNRIWLTWY